MPAILGVFAHPDDEAFGPAGTIARYAAQGVPVDLLTFTKGQVGTMSPGADTPEALGRLREYETRASAKLLGIRELTILDYMDGQLDQADVEDLTAHVTQAIKRGGIDAMIGFGPIGITRHGDHMAAHRAMMHAAARSAGDMRVFYQAVIGEFAKQLNVEGPEAQPTHTIDVSETFETKLMSLACHSSQEDSRQFFAMMAQNRLHVEWFHRARPPYTSEQQATDLFA